MDAKREEGVTPRGRAMSESPSLPSYAEYPTGRPFINTAQPYRSRAARAFPESSSAAILSALRNLQEKIRQLELERCDARLKLQSRDNTHSTQRPAQLHNTDLLSQLTAAEAQCSRLERQLELMRKSVRNTQSDRTAALRQQVSVDPADLRLKLLKLDVLEQEYQRLMETQSAAESKIRQLDRKLQEEEHQRKLVQDTAAQLQTGLEANRLLIQSVSPRPHKPSRGKQKSSSARHPSGPQPHYRLSLGDVPFVTGTSTGSSHSVRANVQRVLHLMKQHHPQLCNEHVLGHAPSPRGHAPSSRGHAPSSRGPAPSCSCAEELSELLLALQDEFGHMSFEQQELSRQIQACSSDRLRQDLEREMEALMKRMENKGEQIAKVRRHQTQMEKARRPCGQQVQAKARPGDRSRDSLRLLKDMRSLQSSLRWDF